MTVRGATVLAERLVEITTQDVKAFALGCVAVALVLGLLAIFGRSWLSRLWKR